MKIIELFVYSLQEKRGTENATLSLAKGLANKYDVRIVSLLTQDETGIIDGVKTSDLGISSSLKIIVFVKLFFTIFFRYKLKDKTVISSSPYITLVLLIFRKLMSKLITIEHAPYIHFSNGINLLRRALYRYLDFVVCLSKEDYTIFSEFSKAVILPNFIIPPKDLTPCALNESTKQGLKIAFLGRFSSEKGGGRFIDFAEYYLKNFKNDVTFYMIGNGPLYSEYKGRLDSSLYQDKIILCSPITCVSDIADSIDANFVCSDYESFGLTIIEFMMLGKPTFAFDIDNGPRNIINNGKNGYLVPKYDFEMMSKAIEEYIGLSETALNNMRIDCISSFKNYHYHNAYKFWKELLV